MTATLWIFTIIGFYAGASMQGISYPDMAACEAARPGVEAEMAWRGYVGIVTVCKPALGKEDR